MSIESKAFIKSFILNIQTSFPKRATTSKSNQDEILEGAGVDVILPESNNTPLLRTLLDRQYRKYSATQTVLGETVKTFEQWRNEEGLEWQNSFNALKKLWVSNSIPTLDTQGNPIGLQIILSTGVASSGSLTVTLRHEPNKSAEGVSDGDITNAGGETDITTTFNVSIQ